MFVVVCHHHHLWNTTTYKVPRNSEHLATITGGPNYATRKKTAILEYRAELITCTRKISTPFTLMSHYIRCQALHSLDMFSSLKNYVRVEENAQTYLMAQSYKGHWQNFEGKELCSSRYSVECSMLLSVGVL
jgi:hypothetical protein